MAAPGPSGGPLGGAGRQLGHVHPTGSPEPRPGDRHFLGQMDRWTCGQAPLKGAAGSPAAHAFGLPKREVGTQRQPGLLCPSPRALRVAWPRAPLLRGRWALAAPSPSLCRCLHVDHGRVCSGRSPPGTSGLPLPKAPLPGAQRNNSPRPARLHPGPVHGPHEAARGTHSAVGTQARGPGMRTPSLFIRVTQLDPTGLSVQQRTAGGAPGEDRGAQGRGSLSPALGTEAGGARGGGASPSAPGAAANTAAGQSRAADAD